jgi:hypothetical protein
MARGAAKNRWLAKVNLKVPAPLSAFIIFAVAVGLIFYIGTDWSTWGLPGPGEPGRYDWAVAKYYKDWRMKRDRAKEEYLKAHPELREFAHLPAEELARRLKDRQRDREQK